MSDIYVNNYIQLVFLKRKISHRCLNFYIRWHENLKQKSKTELKFQYRVLEFEDKKCFYFLRKSLF